MRRLWTVLSLVVAAVMVVATACGPTPTEAPVEEEKPTAAAETSEEAETSGEGGPQRGGTLRIALEAEPDNLDPHFLIQTSSMRVMEMMYSTLLHLGPDMDISPDLATDWEVSEDGTTFTFNLREGVKFWCNGREMVAEDVKYSLDRLSDPDGGSPWNYAWGALDRIEVVDDYTVRIVMTEPSAQLLAQIATPWTAIVPKEVVEENGGSLKTTACGTGPFELVEWEPYQHIKMERNEDYYNPDLPYLDELMWVPIEDEATRAQQMMSGEMDMDLVAPPKSISTYENASNIKLVSGPVCSYFYIGLNANREPFSDVRARQAVAWALDREEILEAVAFGQGTALKGGLIGPDTFWAYSDITVYPEPDLEKARELLAEAGYEDGVEVDLVCRAESVYEDQAQMIKAQLEEAGFTVNINAMEQGAVTQKVWSEGDFDMTPTRWGTWVDPDDFLYGEFHTEGSWNPYGCGTAEIDALLEKGRREMDPEERKKIYKEAERLIAEHACYVLEYRPYQYAAVQDYVMGFQHETGNTRLSIRETWIAEK